ncbi:MAG: hypothetical protein U5K84_10900 [Alkalibacterium sp.]|nr:hypothetical protein [Alkalibacterium sp.]
MIDKKERIIEVIENLSAISEENAAGTKRPQRRSKNRRRPVLEIANSSEQLANLAEEMKDAISKFNY